MNQEKIMKRKMICAIVMFIAALIGLFVMAGLYADKSEEVQEAYRAQFKENMDYAADEIDEYLKTEKDLDLHYSMIVSDMGAARSMIFLIDGAAEEQKVINELHYCFVKYPQQMQGKERDKAVQADHRGDRAQEVAFAVGAGAGDTIAGRAERDGR